MDINNVELWGTITNKSRYIDIFGATFYTGDCICERASGIKDCIKVVSGTPITFDHVKISGKIRSRHNNGKLESYVLVKDMRENDSGINENETIVEGFICSQPFYKQTRTKQLTQFLLCTNGYRHSYLSVLVWDKTDFNTGDHIVVSGRLQSRRFIKDGLPVEVNELSAHKMPVQIY